MDLDLLNGMGSPLYFIDWKLFYATEITTIIIEMIFFVACWQVFRKESERTRLFGLVLTVIIANAASALFLLPWFAQGFV